jgi:hypothetical protein
MTATATTARGGGGRTVLWVVLVVGALLAIGALTVSNRSDEPYDTDSVTPTGTRAFVELLESFGTDVDVPATFVTADAEADVALIFQDATGPDQVEALRSWVGGGATLVVADPYSALAPIAQLDGTNPLGTIDQGRCTVGALEAVQELDPSVPDLPATAIAPTFEVGDEDTSCFGNGSDAFVVVTPVGDGRIVSLGAGTVFMNGAIDQADNAALATSLFAPSPGTRLAIIEPGAFGDGTPVDELGTEGSIDRLFGTGLRLLVLEAAVAVAVLALAQGRRLGKPVAEPQPVQIAGSELVRAMGDLLRQAGSPTDAAAVLRADLRREICRRVGLSPSTSVEIIAATVDARTGIGRERVLAVIADHPVARERDLVELARSIDSIREEILHVPSA